MSMKLEKANNWEIVATGLLIGLGINPPAWVIGSLGVILFSRQLLFKHVSIKQGVLLGFLINILVFHWVPEVFKNYAQVSIWLSILFLIAVSIYQTIKFLVFQSLFNKLQSSSALSNLFIAASLWAFTTLLFPSLAPWFLSSTFIDLPPIALLTRMGGPIFCDISLILLLGTFLLCLVQIGKKEPITKSFLAFFILLSGCLLNWSLSNSALSKELAGAKSISATTIQANLIVGYDYSAARVKVRNKRLQDLTDQALKAYPETDLILWTETAWGYIFWEDEKGIEKHKRRDPLPKHKKHLLFGHYTRIEPKSERKEAMKKRPIYYNSASLLKPDGSFSGQYRKKKLFPFSEKAPVKFLEKYFQKEAFGLTEGKSKKTVDLNGSRIAVGICFEDLWTEVFQEATGEEDASLLVTLTNGGWFDQSSATRQHRDGARWRAVENGRFLLRAANEGPASLIDPWGRITILTAAETETWAHLPQVKLLDKKTLYSKYGNFVVWGLILLSLPLLLTNFHKYRPL